MDEKEGSDWKVRQANYDEILKQMSDPSPQLLQQLQGDLPKFLNDVNPNCLRVALSICEQYFDKANTINYPHIARILIDKSFTTNRPQNSEVATSLLLQCIRHSHDSVLNNVYDELATSKSPRIVKALIALLGNYISEGGMNDANTIIDRLTPLLDHRDQSIRKEANAVIGLARGTPPKGYNFSQTSPHQRQKSPSKIDSQMKAQPDPNAKRNRSPIHKRRGNSMNASSMWSGWISKPILELLKHQKWQSVVSGFEELKKQYQEENGNPSACAYGLTTLFIGRTFTPKVMSHLLTDILFYIKEDPVNITDDTITSILHFVIDKITDKRLEAGLFEMADIVCELMTPPYVFQAFYQQLTAKNYALPARICNYFVHSIQEFGIESKLNPDEVSEQIKPLCTHSDPNVRKSAIECVSALAVVFGENVLDGFRFLKPAQINDIKKSMPAISSNIASNTGSRPSLAANQNVGQGGNLIGSAPKISPSKTLTSGISKKVLPHESPPRKKESSPPARIKSDPSPPAKIKNDSPSNIAVHKNIKNPSRPQPQRPSAISGTEFIPNRLLQGISKTSTALENRKSFDELDELLSRSLELRGPSSIKLSEFSTLFNYLRQWFNDNSTPTVASVAKILLHSLKLIISNEVQNIPSDFIMDIFLLLNYSQKSIRGTTQNIITELNNKIPNFVQNFMINSFSKLNSDGKKATVSFMRELNFTMTLQPFLNFIVGCMSDKSNELRDAAQPIIQQYLQLPNAIETITEYVDSYPPAKKNIILQVLNSSGSNTYFIEKPTEEQKEKREEKIDRYLPLKVLNGTENASMLTEKLEHYGQRFFNTKNFSSTDASKIEEVCSLFINAANEDFHSLSLTLDIVFLWWAQLSLLIQHKESFDEIFNFLLNFLAILEDHNRKLNEFELTLILPTVLECVGRQYERCPEIQKLVFELSPYEYLLPVLVYILGNVKSVNAVLADFNALLSLIPQKGMGNIQADLVKTATKIHSILSKDPAKNPDLFQTSEAFIEFLKKNGALSSSLDAKPISRCNLSPKISAKLKQPSILVYQWIVDLSSQDTQITIQALKSISQQLKTEPQIFEPHLEALIVSLITSVHTYFASDPPASRLCKYIAFCLLTLFNETSLKDTIPQPFVQQLVYEMLTHLSNGINEAVLNQVLNALIVKLINDCTMFAFIGLLSAIGEFENREQFTERWIRLALKCFEACGVRICEVKDEASIRDSIILVNNMLTKYGVEQLESSGIGSKIVGVLKSYVNLVFDRFDDVINTKDMKKTLGNDAEIYKLVE